MTGTSRASSIMASVVLCVEATVPRSRANQPAQFKECDKTELHESGGDRMFQLVPMSGGGETDNNGMVGSTSGQVERFLRFGVEVKFRKGKATNSEFLGGIYEDLYSIGDRLQRQLREHAYPPSSGALDGLRTVVLDGEYGIREGEDPGIMYAVIPLRAEFTDDQVLT